MNDFARFAFATVVPDSGTNWNLHKVEDSCRVSSVTPFRAEVSISMCDAEPPANANSDRPWVLRSRFTLRAGAKSAVFHLDRSLTSAFRAGDVVHIAHTARGGLGVAAFRDNALLVAVGAVSAVPLGDDVSVRVAPELWEEAVLLTGPEPGSTEDPRHRFRNEQPVELRIVGKRHLFFRRNETIHDIHVFVKHGSQSREVAARRPSGLTPREETTGKDECISLARIGVCPRIAATTSAYLLAADGLELSP